MSFSGLQEQRVMEVHPRRKSGYISTPPTVHSFIHLPSINHQADLLVESYHPTPASSYGAQKLVVETLINDYTRKGFINGLSMRFPTISVRPGKPTQAASSFLSGMIREPLAGLPSTIPLKDRSFRSWLCSPKTLATNL